MTVSMRPAPGPSREYHFPRFERRSLENGISVVVAPVKKLPVVSVLAVINGGAVAEPRGKEGVAELTALALREGTKGKSGLELITAFEELGTSLETGADWDTTVASMTLLTNHLPRAFEVFSEVLTSPEFPDAEIERLRAERLAERMQIVSEPRGLADESFSRFIYDDGSRYAEPLGGSSASVSGITRADVTDFYRRVYAPDAVTIIFAGDVTVDEAMGLVEKSLGQWKGRREAPPVNADKPARIARASQIIAKPEAAQSELRLGHVGVPRTHPDYFDIVVMNAVLGGLFSSRINLNLREAHGYTYGASSYFDWRRGSGPFVISTAVQSEVTGAAITETLAEIEKMRREKISDEELTLATSYLDGVFPIRYETTSAIASALAGMVTFGLPEDYYDTYRAKVRSVTTAGVLRAAERYVNLDELQIVVVGDASLIRQQVEEIGVGPMSVQDAAEI
ncbi:MAG TPA: pitrilysin family protein [Gemmatimonadaceae bacterium]|nr:pitrilysin family protein [Gemmatimonadaceae bacterium]